MIKKKNIPYLALSSLAISAAIVAPATTFASENQAVPPNGIYVDGATKTYYSLLDFALLSKAEKAQIVVAGTDKIHFVYNGKITTVKAVADAIAAGKSKDEAREESLKAYQPGDLEVGYKDKNGKEISIPTNDDATDELTIISIE
jgi:hypothetical protein